MAGVAIGVDTHKHTHTAAVVTAGTGAAVEDLTVNTDPAGYQRLVDLADRHGQRRLWAIEGTGGYGAGLTRHLRSLEEEVVERTSSPMRRFVVRRPTAPPLDPDPPAPDGGTTESVETSAS